MKITVECAVCGKQTEIKVCDAICAIVEAAKHESIFGGFICAECGEADDDEE